MTVLPITTEIVELSQNTIFSHIDPADRLIAAAALAHCSALIDSDEKLRAISALAVFGNSTYIGLYVL